jgi:hypothetical protein
MSASRRFHGPFLAVLLVASAAQAAEPARAPLPLRAPVQDKNFYLLTLLEKTSAASTDADLKALLEGKTAALGKATTTCALDCDCFAAAMRLSDDEVSRAADALRRLYRTNKTIRQLTDGTLRSSGTYVLHRSKSGEELLATAWLDAARGINNIIDVYGTGKAPKYPAIDSVSFDVKSKAYGQLVHTVAEDLDEQRASLRLFFQPSLRFALYLLRINNRDEAGRFEPMEKRQNAAAIRRLHAIRWKDFPYSAIIVPGYGPDVAGWSFAAEGKLRVEIAARRYREHKAPVIIVSGGYVHPNQTQYCEAVEMKKSLISELGVPAEAIIIEPHARHTTTNLRNAARLIYRYGMPFERTALITTDSFQSSYIEGEAFAKRCDQEFGYQPGKILKRLSVFDLELTPRVESLQINPIDPLDP